mgnify:CR=1 FL=1
MVEMFVFLVVFCVIGLLSAALSALFDLLGRN